MVMEVLPKDVENPLEERGNQKEKAVERAVEEKANPLEKGDILFLVLDVLCLDVVVQQTLHRLHQRRQLRNPQQVEVQLNMAHDSSAIDFQPTASRRSLTRSRWLKMPMSTR